MQILDHIEKYKIDIKSYGSDNDNDYDNYNIVLKNKDKLTKEVFDFAHKIYRKTYSGISNDDILKDVYPQLTEDLWDNKDYRALLSLLMREEMIPYFIKYWKQASEKMYQHGSYRRSFRAPHLEPSVRYIRLTIMLCFGDISYYTSYHTHFRLPFEDQIIYSSYLLIWGDAYSNIWALLIDEGNDEIFQLMEDIVYGKHPIGKVSKEIILALVNSNQEKSWMLVEKLLLSAIRSEGLRQTILECLDEANIGALKYMIKVIIDNKLTRFSSVVRAVDVWVGLGWESERESTVLKTLNFAYDYLEYPEKIENAIKSKDNLEVYMALWAQGVYDVEKTFPLIDRLLEKGTLEKKCLALIFLRSTLIVDKQVEAYNNILDEANIKLLSIYPVFSEVEKQRDNLRQKHPDFFYKLIDIAGKIDVDKKDFEGLVFSWNREEFKKDNLYSLAFLFVEGDDEKAIEFLKGFDLLSNELKGEISETILDGKLRKYERYKKYLANKGSEEFKIYSISDKIKHDFCIEHISDKSKTVKAEILDYLQENKIEEADINILSEILKSKSQNIRQKLITIFLNQEDELVIDIIKALIKEESIDQRLAALDLCQQMYESNRKTKQILEITEAYKSDRKISAKEEAYLSLLSCEKNKLDIENGYGLYNPKKICTSYPELPEVDKNGIFWKYYKERLAENTGQYHPFSKPYSKIKEDLKKLYELILENKNYEYQAENYYGKETYLLENNFEQIKNDTSAFTDLEKFQNYPLYEVWDKWYQEVEWKPVDLFICSLCSYSDSGHMRNIEQKDFVRNYVFDIFHAFKEFKDYADHIHTITASLIYKYPFKEIDSFITDFISNVFSHLSKEIPEPYAKKSEDEYIYYAESVILESVLYRINYYKPTDQKWFSIPKNEIERIWKILKWKQCSRNIPKYPSLIIYLLAYKYGIIDINELYDGILCSDLVFSDLASYTKEQFPFIEEIRENILDTFLAVELERIDRKTEVTKFLVKSNRVYGVKYFVTFLKKLEKLGFDRGFYYGCDYSETPKSTFSYLIKASVPKKEDTQAEFNRLIKEINVSEKYLITAAVFAHKWLPYIANYLSCEALKSAVWWLYAHTNNLCKEKYQGVFALYSPINVADFKQGAVDKAWFLSMYKELGKDRWQTVYDSAKYITDGVGHTRAKLYADIILGNIKIKEVLDRINKSRNQDYLKVYGLVELNKKDPEKDILARYRFLMQFKKESKQFGSAKQLSEAIALKICLENLAMSTGYSNSQRMCWALESKEVQDILSRDSTIKIGETELSLVIDGEGKADILITKSNKPLKSIPAALKKDKSVVALLNDKKLLAEQFIRSRETLEQSMIIRDTFSTKELEELFEHPIISKHLEKLVFISDNNIGFYVNGELIDAKGKAYKLTPNNTARIAHCVDLHQYKVWSDYQSYCFQNKLVQPFKQIFRELYVPSSDELKRESVSNRYEGHQIQVRKTLALLKNRGWTVDYEEGLQKVFHRQGIRVSLYAMADWFSPADVESPTLETIEFQSLKDHQSVKFKDMDPITFSEVMRDIDLVVSIAHVGGVDPEASHSTIEMRAAMVKETARLFKFDNVEVKGSYVFIKGDMAEYNVHLGSAVVHQSPGKYISILAVHSQHRGRLFLPFADDDPRTAELLSKVLLLAKDNEIKDPTILSQILG